MPFYNAVALLPQREQSAQASSATTTATATFAATPKLGNMLVAIAHANVAVANISINTAGYTARVTQDFSSAPVRGIVIFTKMAGAAEGTTIQMTGTGAGLCRLHIIEYSNIASDAIAGTGVNTTAATTITSSIGASARPMLHIAAVATNGNNGGWVSWALGTTVQTVGAMESGEYLTTTNFLANQVGTWTTARDAGMVNGSWQGVQNLAVRPLLQAANRSSTY